MVLLMTAHWIFGDWSYPLWSSSFAYLRWFTAVHHFHCPVNPLHPALQNPVPLGAWQMGYVNETGQSRWFVAAAPPPWWGQHKKAGEQISCPKWQSLLGFNQLLPSRNVGPARSSNFQQMPKIWMRVLCFWRDFGKCTSKWSYYHVLQEWYAKF